MTAETRGRTQWDGLYALTDVLLEIGVRTMYELAVGQVVGMALLVKHVTCFCVPFSNIVCCRI